MPWFVGDQPVGHVHRERLGLVRAHGAFVAGESADGERLLLRGDDLPARSAGLAAFVADLALRGEIRPPLGELYPVTANRRGPVLALVDRTAVAWLGTMARGVHLNGFVRTAGGLSLWLAERSRSKATFPGHLDNLVAGGWAHGLDARATLQKECGEEAGIPPELAAQATAIGALEYVQQDGRSLKPDQLVTFDLALPADFVPRPVDGEVEGFRLWPAAEVAASLRGSALWKPNCALVAIDFLLRHGQLDGELSAAERSDLRRRLG